jgi:hypothetical protein
MTVSASRSNSQFGFSPWRPSTPENKFLLVVFLTRERISIFRQSLEAMKKTFSLLPYSPNPRLLP